MRSIHVARILAASLLAVLFVGCGNKSSPGLSPAVQRSSCESPFTAEQLARQRQEKSRYFTGAAATPEQLFRLALIKDDFQDARRRLDAGFGVQWPIPSGAVSIDPVSGRVEFQVGTGERTTPLMEAAYWASTSEIVRMLLLRGADPNATYDREGRTALMAAAYREQSDADVLRALLQFGARVDARDRLGQDALMHLVLYKEDLDQRPELQCSQAAKLAMLIQSGANVNDRGAGFTPLIHALTMKNFGMARLLVQAGADVNLPASAGAYPGSTPLHVAVSVENGPRPELVQYLLLRGANRSTRDSYGMTARDIAYQELVNDRCSQWSADEAQRADCRERLRRAIAILESG